jgi:hypothetical protein
MHEDSIIRLLMTLGTEYADIVRSGDWVNAPCPLAPWAHAGGADTRPSFGVRVSGDEVSYYYCFGCTPQGQRLDWLLHNIFIMSGRYPWPAAKIFRVEENHYFEGDEHRKPRKPDVWDSWSKEDEDFINPLPHEVLQEYDILQFGHDKEASRCRRWLIEDRLIPEYVANLYKVRYDSLNDALIFPLTDRKGDVFLLRSRSVKQKSIWTISPKLAGYPNLVFPKLRDSGVWFGMWLVDWEKPVMAVEAEVDVLRLAALGKYNVIASATSSVSASQIKTLLMARTVVLGYDADKAGKQAHRRVKDVARSQGGSEILEVDWSVGRKHKQFRKDKSDLKCKDAGDLESKVELYKVLRKALKRS